MFMSCRIRGQIYYYVHIYVARYRGPQRAKKSEKRKLFLDWIEWMLRDGDYKCSGDVPSVPKPWVHLCADLEKHYRTVLANARTAWACAVYQHTTACNLMPMYARNSCIGWTHTITGVSSTNWNMGAQNGCVKSTCELRQWCTASRPSRYLSDWLIDVAACDSQGGNGLKKIHMYRRWQNSPLRSFGCFFLRLVCLCDTNANIWHGTVDAAIQQCDSTITLWTTFEQGILHSFLYI